MYYTISLGQNLLPLLIMGTRDSNSHALRVRGGLRAEVGRCPSEFEVRIGFWWIDYSGRLSRRIATRERQTDSGSASRCAW